MRPRRFTFEHALSITLRAIDPIARFVSLPLAIAIAFAITGEPSIARAQERAAFGDPASDVAAARAADAPGSDDGVAWRPILAGCLGVFFGAAVAVWQIRGRNKHA